MNNRLKQIIFDKLYQDLKHLEIIPYGNSVWFIDRKEKYWYLEYKTRGVLLWRWDFFPRFFNLFSMEINEYEPLISEWVEEVLNCRVETSKTGSFLKDLTVEEVLNCRVETSGFGYNNRIIRVEEVLNCRVETSTSQPHRFSLLVENILNCRVKTSHLGKYYLNARVEEVLNYKIKLTYPLEYHVHQVEKVLNDKDDQNE